MTQDETINSALAHGINAGKLDRLLDDAERHDERVTEGPRTGAAPSHGPGGAAHAEHVAPDPHTTRTATLGRLNDGDYAAAEREAAEWDQANEGERFE